MLNKYEELLEEAAAQNISVDENFPFHWKLKGIVCRSKYRPLGPIGDLCRKSLYSGRRTWSSLHFCWKYSGYLRSCKCKAGTPGTNVTYERLIGLRGLIDAISTDAGNITKLLNFWM